MDNPKGEPVPRAPLRHLWLIAVVPLAALALAELTAHINAHQNPWQQKLAAFQDDPNLTPWSGKYMRMNDEMVLKNKLQLSIKRRQPMKLSPAQDRLLIDCLNGPVDERSQSEALDVLNIAQRNDALSSPQTHTALDACLAVLSRRPAPMVRLEGARFLWHSKSSRGIPALRFLLNDPEPKTRDAATRGLAELGRGMPPQKTD